MSIFIIPSDVNGECCDCYRAIDPCTCCDFSLGRSQFSEEHGNSECPKVQKPCGVDDYGSCSGSIIGPVTLYSQKFKTKCLERFSVMAYASLFADNFGYVQGVTSIGCPATNACVLCQTSGGIEPNVEKINNTESRAYVFAFGQNAIHGGPYSLNVSVNFYLQ